MPLTMRYHFRQRFAFPARQAFEWCTDFDPKDHELMGDVGAERHITRLTDTTIILREVFPTPKGKIEKEKLVQLYPGTLSWTNTHLTGPNKYSQFLYQITPEGKDASILDFTGLHLDYERKSGAEEFAEKLCKEDAAAWKLLAKAMEKDLKK